MPSLETALEIADLNLISDLNLSMFGRDDLLNVILQRSETIRDQHDPDRVVQAWEAGDCEPAYRIIDKLGADIVRRAMALVFLEYLELKPLLHRIKPKVVADIGCGYGFFGFFLQQDFDCEVVLVDLEESPNRHFDFKDKAAAYTSLATTRRFYVSNGRAENSITTLNPEYQDLHSLRNVDLTVSFLSCGFHFPWETYSRFFTETVMPSGSIILDIRRRRVGKALKDLAEFGDVSRVGSAAFGKATRIHVEKHAVAMARTA